jgi:hypothetical protein
MKSVRVLVVAVSAAALLAAPALAASARPDLHTEGTTSLFLSRDTHPFTHDVALGTVTLPRIKVGHTSEKGTQLQLPASTPPGRYVLVACTDATHKVAESNERNDCFGSATEMQVVAG